jgi:hypothetical protein
VESDSSVENVEEEMDIPGVGKVTSHRLKHTRYQSHPHELVKNVKSQQLL